jgi:hypothetical protein
VCFCGRIILSKMDRVGRKIVENIFYFLLLYNIDLWI